MHLLGSSAQMGWSMFLLSPWDAMKRGCTKCGGCGHRADGPLSPPGSLRAVLHAETLPLRPAAVPQTGWPPGPQKPLQTEGDGDPPRPRGDAPLRPHRGEGEELGGRGWDPARHSPPSSPHQAKGALEHSRRMRVRRGRSSIGAGPCCWDESPPTQGPLLRGLSAWESPEPA